MTCRDCLIHDICEEKEKLMLTVDNLYELIYQEAVEVSCKHFKNKADYIAVDKVAEMLAKIGLFPCRFSSVEKWLTEVCEIKKGCSKTLDSECWKQFFKHYEKRGGD